MTLSSYKFLITELHNQEWKYAGHRLQCRPGRTSFLSDKGMDYVSNKQIKLLYTHK